MDHFNWGTFIYKLLITILYLGLPVLGIGLLFFLVIKRKNRNKGA